MAKKLAEGSALASTTQNLFRLQLAGAGVVPASVQRAAFRMASKAQSVELLELLAKRSDAPEDVLEGVRQRSEIPVRVAYLTRKGHTPEVLKGELAGEKRAGVLSALVMSEGTSEEILGVIGEVFLSKPTKALSEALIQRSPSEEVLAVAYEILAPRYPSLTGTLQGHVSSAATKLARSTMRSKAAMVSAPFELARVFMPCTGLTSEARVALVGAMEGMLDAVRPTQWQTQRSYHGGRAVTSVLAGLTQILSAEDVQGEVVAKVAALAGHAALLPSESQQISDLVKRTSPGREEVALDEPRSAQGAKLGALVAKASRGRDDVLAVGLLKNPHLALEQAQTLVRVVTDKAYLVRSMGEMPLDTADEVFFYDSYTAMREDALGQYADVEAAKVRLVRKAVAMMKDQKQNRYRAYNSPLLALAGVELPDEAVREMPWSFFTGGGYYYVDAALTKAAQRVAGLQSAVLGESVGRWEMFNSLGASFDGSVGDLLGMVETLSAMEE